MPDQPTKKYMCDLLNALNEEVDFDDWGAFIRDNKENYVWCDHAYSSKHPEMRLRFSVDKGRVTVATASRPRIFFENQYITASSETVEDQVCTFASNRPLYQCAREIVRKVLTPWAKQWWPDGVREVEEQVKRLRDRQTAKERVAAAMKVKHPPSNRIDTLRHYPGDNRIGTVAAHVLGSNVDLELHGLPADVAVKVLDFLNGLIPLK